MLTLTLTLILIYVFIGLVTCALLPKTAYEHIESLFVNMYSGDLKLSQNAIRGLIMAAITIWWLPSIKSIIRMYTMFKD